jgi:hypothetical protein
MQEYYHHIMVSQTPFDDASQHIFFLYYTLHAASSDIKHISSTTIFLLQLHRIKHYKCLAHFADLDNKYWLLITLQ